VAQELKAIPFPNFPGLRLDQGLDEVGAGGAIFLRDVDWDGSLGKLRSRDGFKKLKAAEATGTYKALFPHSSLRLLATKRVTAESVKLVAIDREGTEKTEATWTKEVCKANFAHYGIPTASYTYGRGAVTSMKPIRFDGTTFTEPTCKIFEGTTETGSGKEMPRANFMQAWPDQRNRMAFANMGATGGPNGAASNNSRIWFSKAGSAEEFETTAFVDLGVGDGEEIVGMCLYGGQIFVFKETKFFVFYSVSLNESAQPEFNFREVSMGEGSRMKRAAQTELAETSDQICAPGPDGVYFATTDGVYVTAGGAPTKISQALRPLEEASPFAGPMATFLNGSTESCRWPAAGIVVLGTRVFVKRYEYLFIYDIPTQEWLCWKMPNVSLAVWTGLTGGGAEVSEKAAGKGENSAAVGEAAWSNPENIKAFDSSYASCAPNFLTSRSSQRLIAKKFGFAVPTEATIVGIKVELARKATELSGEIKDFEASLLKAGAVAGTDKSLPEAWKSIEADVFYGGSEDLWGTTWTPAQINEEGFGFALRVRAESSGSREALVNVVGIYVFYTLPASGTGIRPRLFCTQSKSIFYTAPEVTEEAGTRTPEYESGFYDLESQDEKTLEHFKVWGTGAVKLQVAKDFGEPGEATEVTLGTSPAIAQGSGNKSQTASMFSHRFSGAGPWSIQRFIRYLRETRVAATKTR